MCAQLARLFVPSCAAPSGCSPLEWDSPGPLRCDAMRVRLEFQAPPLQPRNEQGQRGPPHHALACACEGAAGSLRHLMRPAHGRGARRPLKARHGGREPDQLLEIVPDADVVAQAGRAAGSRHSFLASLAAAGGSGGRAADHINTRPLLIYLLLRCPFSVSSPFARPSAHHGQGKGRQAGRQGGRQGPEGQAGRREEGDCQEGAPFALFVEVVCSCRASPQAAPKAAASDSDSSSDEESDDDVPVKVGGSLCAHLAPAAFGTNTSAPNPLRPGPSRHMLPIRIAGRRSGRQEQRRRLGLRGAGSRRCRRLPPPPPVLCCAARCVACRLRLVA